MTAAAWSGFQLALGLILVIGSQNAFVLRQGLRREHVLATVLFCAVSDALLIGLGVAGLAGLAGAVPGLLQVLRWGGVLFLAVYGLRTLYAALRGAAALTPRGATPAGLGETLTALALMTWANPHVWLDTVVLIGSVASQYPGREAAFGAGAACGSALFFATLGFGARLVAPVFARPRAWQVLDVAVALILWRVAWSLAVG